MDEVTRPLESLAVNDSEYVMRLVTSSTTINPKIYCGQSTSWCMGAYLASIGHFECWAWAVFVAPARCKNQGQ